MTSPPLTFITSSENKLNEVTRLLGRPLARAAIALDEIQEVALEPVVAHKARQAYAALHTPVLVEDTGLACAAWNGLPGALVKWFLSSLGNAGLCRLMRAETNRTAMATTVFGYFDGTFYRAFAGTVAGIIVESPRGTQGFGWDAIFQPLGSDHTFAEMNPEEKDRFSMRRLAVEQLRASGLLG
ncbi:MAG: non-canonical purine NTP pyrophosphatase [Deltaproteobacteria bacterium]|nr:non-canonical purine NTP pyrophosphatase [Deltaproteobacteria bacterium]